MRRSQWVCLLFALGFLLFLCMDLRIRYRKEQQKRLKMTTRIRKLSQRQGQTDIRLAAENRGLGRMRRRLYHTGGTGELCEFDGLLDSKLTAIGKEVRKEVLSIRRRQKEQSKDGGPPEGKIRLPEKELREATSLMLESEPSVESFHQFFRIVFLWGEVGWAIQGMEQLGQKYPDDLRVKYYRAQANLLQARSALTSFYRDDALFSAMRYFDDVLLDNPEHVEARFQRGQAATRLSVRHGRVGEGIRDLKWLMERPAVDASIRASAACCLGEAYLSLGWTDRAREAFTVGALAHPTHEGLGRWAALFSGE